MEAHAAVPLEMLLFLKIAEILLAFKPGAFPRPQHMALSVRRADEERCCPAQRGDRSRSVLGSGQRTGGGQPVDRTAVVSVIGKSVRLITICEQWTTTFLRISPD